MWLCRDGPSPCGRGEEALGKWISVERRTMCFKKQEQRLYVLKKRSAAVKRAQCELGTSLSSASAGRVGPGPSADTRPPPTLAVMTSIASRASHSKSSEHHIWGLPRGLRG